MAYTLRWNGATMPDGVEVYTERMRSRARPRPFVNSVGGVIAAAGGPQSREVTLRIVLAAPTPQELRDLIEAWHRQIGYEAGYLQHISATVSRELYCVPTDQNLEYVETVMNVAEIEQRFVAPDPRWRALTTSSQIVQRRARYAQASQALSIPGSAEPIARVYWWPVYGAAETPQEVQITNRFANLVYNADFAIQTPLSTQDGLATPWSSTQYGSAYYQPFTLPEHRAQFVDIVAGSPGGTFRTYCRVPYSFANNDISPTANTIAWSGNFRLSLLDGDWQFYLRLRAFTGTAFGGGVAQTATSAVIGSGGGVSVTVTGSEWSGRLTVTLSAPAGLPGDVRWLQPEFAFVSATAGTKTGGGRIMLREPYMRTDRGGYEYRPHRTLTWTGLSAVGRRALEVDLTDRESWLFGRLGLAVTGNAYLTPDSTYFELQPGTNELHVAARFSGTSAVTGAVTTYPISTQNEAFVEYIPRWWA